MVTKTLQSPKNRIPAGLLQVFNKKMVQTTPEVKSYKTLELINT